MVNRIKFILYQILLCLIALTTLNVLVYADISFKNAVLEDCDTARNMSNNFSAEQKSEMVPYLTLMLKLEPFASQNAPALIAGQNLATREAVPVQQLSGILSAEREEEAKYCASELLRRFVPQSLEAVPDLLFESTKNRLSLELRDYMEESALEITTSYDEAPTTLNKNELLAKISAGLDSEQAEQTLNVLVELKPDSLKFLFDQGLSANGIKRETLLKVFPQLGQATELFEFLVAKIIDSSIQESELAFALLNEVLQTDAESIDSQLGPEKLKYFLTYFHSADLIKRELIMRIFGTQKQLSDEAFQLMRTNVRNSTSPLRLPALRAMGKLLTRKKEVLSLIKESLKSNSMEKDINKSSQFLLETTQIVDQLKYGPEAIALMPYLLQELNASDAAINPLARLGSAIENQVREINNVSSKIAERRLKVLAKLSKLSDSTLTILVDCLKSKNINLALEAQTLLASQSKRVSNRLQKILTARETPFEVRLLTAELLIETPENKMLAHKILLQGWTQGNCRQKAGLAPLLLRQKVLTPTALEAELLVCYKSTPDTRDVILNSLISLIPLSQPTVHELLEAIRVYLEAHDSEPSVSTLEFLERLGMQARELIPVLLHVRDNIHNNLALKNRVITTMALIDIATFERSALQSKDPRERLSALVVLLRLDPDAVDTAQALRRMLKSRMFSQLPRQGYEETLNRLAKSMLLQPMRPLEKLNAQKLIKLSS